MGRIARELAEFELPSGRLRRAPSSPITGTAIDASADGTGGSAVAAAKNPLYHRPGSETGLIQ